MSGSVESFGDSEHTPSISNSSPINRFSVLDEPVLIRALPKATAKSEAAAIRAANAPPFGFPPLTHRKRDHISDVKSVLNHGAGGERKRIVPVRSPVDARFISDLSDMSNEDYQHINMKNTTDVSKVGKGMNAYRLDSAPPTPTSSEAREPENLSAGCDVVVIPYEDSWSGNDDVKSTTADIQLKKNKVKVVGEDSHSNAAEKLRDSRHRREERKQRKQQVHGMFKQRAAQVTRNIERKYDLTGGKAELPTVEDRNVFPAREAKRMLTADRPCPCCEVDAVTASKVHSARDTILSSPEPEADSPVNVALNAALPKNTKIIGAPLIKKAPLGTETPKQPGHVATNVVSNVSHDDTLVLPDKNCRGCWKGCDSCCPVQDEEQDGRSGSADWCDNTCCGCSLCDTKGDNQDTQEANAASNEATKGGAKHAQEESITQELKDAILLFGYQWDEPITFAELRDRFMACLRRAPDTIFDYATGFTAIAEHAYELNGEAFYHGKPFLLSEINSERSRDGSPDPNATEDQVVTGKKNNACSSKLACEASADDDNNWTVNFEHKVTRKPASRDNENESEAHAANDSWGSTFRYQSTFGHGHAPVITEQEEPKLVSKDLNITYWATVESGDQVIHIPLNAKNVSGPEKATVNTDMKKVWKWIQDKKIGDKIGLQEAYDLAKQMHGEDEHKDHPRGPPASPPLPAPGWSDGPMRLHGWGAECPTESGWGGPPPAVPQRNWWGV